ncbi:MAG TPA: hypothetical protein VIT67_12250 [Povalibacter sp.]
MSSSPAPQLTLTDSERAELSTRKVTCPFLGPSVASDALAVLNSQAQPLASIADVVALGNSGDNSDLGDLLKVFCEGNHAFMPGPQGLLDQPVPAGLFSLDLPGSQGSHFGHSGILQGDPNAIGSGRFSDVDFERLAQFAVDGAIRRSDLGKFIAANIKRDPAAHAPGLKTAMFLSKDLLLLAGQAVAVLADKVTDSNDPVDRRKLFTRLTQLLGEDHLLGSSGEFGLLAAFLTNSPRTRQVDATLGTEPAYAMADISLMFKDRRLPDGWQSWTKKARDWVVHTGAIAVAAEKELLLNKVQHIF